MTQQLRKAGLLGSKNGGGGGGSLIANMTSKMGSVDDNGSGGTYAYRASKAALNISECEWHAWSAHVCCCVWMQAPKETARALLLLAAAAAVNKSLSIDLAGEGVTSVLLHPGALPAGDGCVVQPLLWLPA